jgi:hypothetical protein
VGNAPSSLSLGSSTSRSRKKRVGTSRVAPGSDKMKLDAEVEDGVGED